MDHHEIKNWTTQNRGESIVIAIDIQKGWLRVTYTKENEEKPKCLIFQELYDKVEKNRHIAYILDVIIVHCWRDDLNLIAIIGDHGADIIKAVKISFAMLYFIHCVGSILSLIPISLVLKNQIEMFGHVFAIDDENKLRLISMSKFNSAFGVSKISIFNHLKNRLEDIGSTFENQEIVELFKCFVRLHAHVRTFFDIFGEVQQNLIKLLEFLQFISDKSAIFDRLKQVLDIWIYLNCSFKINCPQISLFFSELLGSVNNCLKVADIKKNLKNKGHHAIEIEYNMLYFKRVRESCYCEFGKGNYCRTHVKYEIYYCENCPGLSFMGEHKLDLHLNSHRLGESASQFVSLN